jgi:hypothetical protein
MITCLAYCGLFVLNMCCARVVNGGEAEGLEDRWDLSGNVPRT